LGLQINLLVPCSEMAALTRRTCCGARVCFWFVLINNLQDAGKGPPGFPWYRLYIQITIQIPLNFHTALASGAWSSTTSSLQPYWSASPAVTLSSSRKIGLEVLASSSGYNHHCDWSGIVDTADLYIAKKIVTVVSNDFLYWNKWNQSSAPLVHTKADKCYSVFEWMKPFGELCGSCGAC